MLAPRLPENIVSNELVAALEGSGASALAVDPSGRFADRFDP